MLIFKCILINRLLHLSFVLCCHLFLFNNYRKPIKRKILLSDVIIKAKELNIVDLQI